MSDISLSFNGTDSKEPPDFDMEIQIQLLTDENNRLKNENQKLRIQFEEAVSIHDDVDKMHQSNIELTSKLRKSELERDDLKRRLDLNIGSFQEQLDKEKHDSALRNESANREIANLRQKLEDALKTKSTIESSLDSKLQDIQLKFDSESKKSDILENKLKLILESASKTFKVSFQSPDSLVKYFEDVIPIPKENNNNFHLTPEVEDKKDEKRKKKENELIKKLKYKVQREQLRCKQIKNQLIETQNIINKIQESSSKSKDSMEMTISQLNNKIASQDTYYKKIIEQLNQSLAKTREELTQAKSQIISPIINSNSSINNSSIQQENYVEKLQERHLKEIANIKLHHSTLLKELRENEMQLQKNLLQETKLKNEALNKSKTYENEVQELTLHVDRLKNENQNLLKQNTFIENERKTIQEELMKLALSKKENESKTEAVLLKKIQNYEMTINNNKVQMSNQQNHIQKYQNEINSLHSEITRKQNEYNELKKQMDETASENQMLNQKIIMMPKPLLPDEIVPPSCFILPGYPSSLTVEISKIANNESLQPASKVQFILSVIKSHYSTEIAQLEEGLQKFNNEKTNENTIFIGFIDQLCEILGIQKETSEQIYSNPHNLTSFLEEFKRQYDKVIVDNNVLSLSLREIKNQIDCPEEQNIIDFISPILNEYYTLKEDKSHLTQKYSLFRRKKKIIIEKLSETVRTLSCEVDGTKSQLKIALVNIENRDKEIEKLTADNQNLELQLADLKQNFDDLSFSNQNLSKEMDTIVEKSIETTKFELKHEINNLNEQIRELTNQNESYQKSASVYKKAIDVLKTKLVQSINAISELKKANAKDKEEFQARCNQERENIQKTNEETTNQLRKQCSELRDAMIKLNEIISELEAKNAKLVKDNMEFKRQYTRIESQMASQVESNERERKLMENHLHSLKIKMESNMAAKISSVQANADKERQKLIVYFADNFRGFFDPNEQIDVKMYQRLLDRAKAELTRLQLSDNAIRRLTNASTNQTTEDAVAQYVFKSMECN
ncbi:hypothetical protein TRFO_34308 [Tritrichomonas foetus]|uniref:Uncharacterized protein n=1 Tax=Tritrichomonas foetus TaxID=1144522 RepID=A0A1J4JJE9_9EUKA|nr:hypothetical protein TRFO_34308 [Tritrichomonas foetus]|eukprot:OHS99280.1 hypothetical protein TRFO_34308 [Tritrichomonas foetus]